MAGVESLCASGVLAVRMASNVGVPHASWIAAGLTLWLCWLQPQAVVPWFEFV
jgi:hypothetical protein